MNNMSENITQNEQEVQTLQINYRSDFSLRLHNEGGWTVPFTLDFWAEDAPLRHYIAQMDSEGVCRNCKVDEEDSEYLLVTFDDHGLGKGQLKMIITYHVEDVDFRTGFDDEVANTVDVVDTETTGGVTTEKNVVLAETGELNANITYEIPASEAERQRRENEIQRQENEAARILAEAERERQAAADHLQAGNDHTRAGEDHTLAASDHTRAGDDHTLAASDHVTAASDHGIAADDHTLAASDHVTAASDHGIAADDHTLAGNDHTQAVADHGIAADDHTLAASDHSTASTDHTNAASDHTRAGEDHTLAAADHTQAAADHSAFESFGLSVVSGQLCMTYNA